MTKTDCIENFNNIINGIPIDFNSKLLPLISEYIIDHTDKSSQAIDFIQQQPDLIQQILPVVIRYLCAKYNICEVIKNNQTILFYE